MKKILFLGYKNNRTCLIQELKNHPKVSIVKQISRPINLKDTSEFDIIISFGYRHIINKRIIKYCKKTIINLHLSYLPYNKGSHPNVWSFLTNTTSGITIHTVSEKVDEGDIIFRKKINFNIKKNKKKLTFSNTYNFLFKEIEQLFISKINSIIDEDFKFKKQISKGTFHKKESLPAIIKNWNQNIFNTVRKYSKIRDMKKHSYNKSIKIVNQIQKIRSKNNVNWMNLLKLSLKLNPKKTSSILSKIYEDDQRISKLISKLKNL